MKRIAWCGLLVLILSPLATAQDRPKVVLFGGYSFASIKPASSVERVETNGWHTNVAIRATVVDLVADFSGHYGTLSGTGMNVHTFMFGPRFAYHGKKVSWFVHSLYGVSRIKVNGDILNSVFNGKSDTAFNFIPGGGGLEIKINEKIAFRVIEFDLIFSGWGKGTTQIHPRLSTGVVFRFSKK